MTHRNRLGIRSILRTLYGVLAAIIAVCTPLSAYAAGAPTATTLAITSNGATVTAVAPGTVITLTATVGEGPGTVKFCDASASQCTDEHLLSTAQLTATGIATYKFVPGIGIHHYSAIFVGTTTYAASTSQAQTLTVTSGSFTISQTGEPGSYTLTAAMASAAAGPTGSVSFLDTTNADASLGTAAFSAIRTAYAPGLSLSASADIKFIKIGDFNNDGILDIITVNAVGSTISVFLGKGDGTYQTGTPFSFDPIDPDNPSANGIAVGDFNNDGNLDIAVTASPDYQSILLGNGDGTFTYKETYAGSGRIPYAIALGDFNRDGNLDIVTVNSADNAVTVNSGDGSGGFQSGVQYGIGASPTTVAIGDFNGDGILDLATANGSDNTVSILLGQANGTFGVATPFNTGANPFNIAIGDFNGDGFADIATASFGDNAVTILLGKGDGTFEPAVNYPAGTAPNGLSVGDFNGDGILDIVVTNISGLSAVTILFGKGDGTFNQQLSLANDNPSSEIAIGDFNGDGLLDLAFTYYEKSTVSMLLDQIVTPATATLSNISIPGSGAHIVNANYAGDTNNAAALTTNTVSLAGSQIPTMLSLTSSTGTSSFGQQVVLTAKLSPYSSGNLSTNAENVVFLSNGATIGTGALVSGLAAFNTTSLPSGADNLTAVYGGDSNFVTSISAATTVTVTQASILTPTLTFAAIADVVDGIAPFSVYASSPSTGAVTYLVTSGPATISGSTVTVTGVGTVTLSATQAAAGNYAAATATTSFNVKAAPVTTLDFTMSAGTATQSQSIRTGGAATYSFQVAPTGNAYPGDVTFTASGVPTGAFYEFSPSTIAANGGPGSVNFTVRTASNMAFGSGFFRVHGLDRGFTPIALSMLLLPFATARRMRKSGRKMLGWLSLLLVVFCGAMSLSGCAGSSSAQAKNYTITITATSGAMQHTSTVALQVQ